jgi:signal transduction histidine kinase
MKRRTAARIALALAGVLCAPGAVTSAFAQVQSVRTVLVVTLGAENFPANPILDAGIREALASKTDLPIDVFTEYLESDMFPGEEASVAFRDYVRRKYAGRKIDVVIAISDTAVAFALAHRAELFPDAAIIFSGLALPREGITGVDAGLTGLRVGIAHVETLQLALTLQPATREVFVVAQGRDAATIDAIRSELRGAAGSVRVTYLAERTIPELLAAVRTVPQGSVILYIWHTQREPGHVVYPDVVARLVAEAAAVPVYGTSDFYVGSGVVGGVVRGTGETGTRLGQMALRILTGTPVRDIPIETARTVPILDWRQLRRWGISEARVPDGAEIRFRDKGIWGRYKFYIVGAAAVVLAQSGLIGALLVQAGRRRRAETRIRDLGGRLLGAQEAERSRIARELHDDVSQQAALLVLDLQWLADGSRDTHDTNELARQAAERGVAIAQSVHDLSHRLHPAKLRMVGLVPALQSLCHEFPQTVTVTFSHHDVPDGLSDELTLCLFRIVQEAVQNAVKHGAAHDVSVELAGKPSVVSLSVVDDGIGFDVDAVSTDGLGLISMRERVEALGGTVKIHSQRGAGTRVQVSVPIASRP